MSAPVIETIRPGVAFTPLAAASFRRVEARLGRRIDVNSTYRDYNKQLSMYRAWNLHVAGRGPHPGHSRAIHPDLSAHCKGLGLDSDDWSKPGFIELMAEHGWIRTAPNDPTERHHFEYQSWRDQHIGELAGNGINPIAQEAQEEDEDMALKTIQIVYAENDRYYRALVTPGTAYFMPWNERGSEYAVPIGEALETGGSVTVTKSLYLAFEAAAARVAGGSAGTANLTPVLDAIGGIPKVVNDDAAERLKS